MTEVKLLDELIKFLIAPRKYLWKKKLERRMKTDPELLERALNGETFPMPPSIIKRTGNFIGNHIFGIINFILVSLMIFFVTSLGFTAIDSLTSINETTTPWNVTAQNGTFINTFAIAPFGSFFGLALLGMAVLFIFFVIRTLTSSLYTGI